MKDFEKKREELDIKAWESITIILKTLELDKLAKNIHDMGNALHIPFKIRGEENWKLIGKVRDYSFWSYDSNHFVRGGKVFQVTTNDKPPTNEAGYGTLEHLTNIKNVSPSELPN